MANEEFFKQFDARNDALTRQAEETKKALFNEAGQPRTLSPDEQAAVKSKMLGGIAGAFRLGLDMAAASGAETFMDLPVLDQEPEVAEEG